MSSKSSRQRHQLKETVGDVAEADGCLVRPVGVAQREEFRQPGESLAGDPALDGPVGAYLSRSETWAGPPTWAIFAIRSRLPSMVALTGHRT